MGTKTTNHMDLERRLNKDRNYLYRYMNVSDTILDKLARMPDRESQLEFFKSDIIANGHESLNFLVDNPDYVDIAEQMIEEMTQGRGDRVIIAPRRKITRKVVTRKVIKKERVTTVIVRSGRAKRHVRTYSKWSKEQNAFVIENKDLSSKEMKIEFRKEFKDTPKTDSAIYFKHYRIKKK